MKRYHIIFKGTVQAVGFRYTLKMIADKYGAKGSVKNLDNGDVEAYLQQNADVVDLIIGELKNNKFIKIREIEKEEIHCINENEFKILR